MDELKVCHLRLEEITIAAIKTPEGDLHSTSRFDLPDSESGSWEGFDAPGEGSSIWTGKIV